MFYIFILHGATRFVKRAKEQIFFMDEKSDCESDLLAVRLWKGCLLEKKQNMHQIVLVVYKCM